MLRTLPAVLLVALMTCFAAPVAWAQAGEPDEANKTTARELAKQGFAALDGQEYEKAADLFRKAEALFHAPTLLVGLCKAEAELQRYVEAFEACNQAARELLDERASPAFVAAVAEARELLGTIEPRIAWVVIEVSGHDEPTVSVDGTAIPTASLGLPRALNPGEHLAEARAQGYLDTEQAFTAEAGNKDEPARVVLELEPDPAAHAPTELDPAPSASPASPAEPDSSDDPGASQRIWGWLSLGVGGAALIGGGVTGYLAMDAHGELTDRCTKSGQCPPDEQETIDHFHMMGTISTIGFIAGGVLAATGTVLVLTAPSADDDAAEVSAELGPGTMRATVRF